MYAIPLDSARQDAAPHGHPGSSAGVTRGSGSGGTGGSGATGGSGSSSTGGAPRTGGTSTASGGSTGGSEGTAGAATGSANTAGLVPGGQPGSLIHSANGFGSSSLVPGLRGPLGSTVSTPQASANSAPQLAMFLSLVLLAAGLFVGTRAWRGPRRASRSQPS